MENTARPGLVCATTTADSRSPSCLGAGPGLARRACTTVTYGLHGKARGASFCSTKELAGHRTDRVCQASPRLKGSLAKVGQRPCAGLVQQPALGRRRALPARCHGRAADRQNARGRHAALGQHIPSPIAHVSGDLAQQPRALKSIRRFGHRRLMVDSTGKYLIVCFARQRDVAYDNMRILLESPLTKGGG